MADETKVEVKPGEPSKDDSFNYKRDTVKTLRQIGKESADRIRKAKLEGNKKKEEETITKVETSSTEEAQEEKKDAERSNDEGKKESIDVDAIAKKAAEETALRVASETKESFKSEIAKILDKDKDILEKQKEADELISIWDKEKRLPTDYKEVVLETLRLSEVKMQHALKARQVEEEKTRQEQETKDKTNRDELIKKNAEKQLDDFNKQIAKDLDEIYSVKLLPRPVKFEEINNPNTTDPAAKETQRVLEFGIKLNTKLRGEGKEPITSLSKIYFLHYKPYTDANPVKKEEQPAGANAPVAGGRHTPMNESGSKVSYQQLHTESWAQTKARLVRETAKRLLNK